MRQILDSGSKLLKGHGVQPNVNGMFERGAATGKLAFDEKRKFEQGDEGCSFGYKAAGANGTLDPIEFIGSSKTLHSLGHEWLIVRISPPLLLEWNRPVGRVA
ncbi:hypothetical protein L218DRAFT_1009270 [Marasmius fiardii PR-910]|nr:hypothetical protein L218DRAFT_1009270 [Marasmius fiardii PR-910]